MSSTHPISLLLGFMLFTSCNLLESGNNQILKEIYNQRQSKKAILFLKRGNATTDNSLQVKLARYDYQLNAKDVGNALTTDSNHGQVQLDVRAISFAWKGDDTLVITMNKNLRTFTKKNKAAAVTIIYKEE